MQSPEDHSAGRDEVAPWYRIPDRTVVSVEHPCIVRNAEKAVSMLGGSPAIEQILERDAEKPMALTFHPEDRAARPLMSTNAATNNLLLKIAAPKRTGRKRKRGSNHSFTYDNSQPAPKDAHYLVQSLKDNPTTYSLEPIATIPSTHLWRTMPDFVYSTTTSPFFRNFRSSILPLTYPALKTFDLDLTQVTAFSSTEVIPPPILSTASVPHNHPYRQNPAVKTITDPLTGAKTLLNSQAPMKVHTWQMQHDTKPYPTALPPAAPPLATIPYNFRSLISILTSLFDTRPLWTRRALLNHLPLDSPVFLTRYALAYISFAIRSGPWRDTYCRIGVDPRSSPSYRKHQSVLLQLVPSKGPKTSATNPTNTNSLNLDASATAYARTWSRSPDRTSHIFTGSGPVPPDGKAWQLCDLHDPLLKSLVDVPDLHLRATCEERYFGWYPNGTQSKSRILLKTKVDAMMDGLTLADLGVADAQVQRFVDLPEEWDGVRAVVRGGKAVDPNVAYLVPRADVREMEKAGTITKAELRWASAYRSMCRAKDGELPSSNGRLSKSKPEARESFMGPKRRRSSIAGTDTPKESVGEGIEGLVDGEDVLEGFEEPEGEGNAEGDGDKDGDDGNVETGAAGQYDGAMDLDEQMEGGGETGQDYEEGNGDPGHMEDW